MHIPEKHFEIKGRMSELKLGLLETIMEFCEKYNNEIDNVELNTVLVDMLRSNLGDELKELINS